MLFIMQLLHLLLNIDGIRICRYVAVRRWQGGIPDIAGIFDANLLADDILFL